MLLEDLNADRNSKINRNMGCIEMAEEVNDYLAAIR